MKNRVTSLSDQKTQNVFFKRLLTSTITGAAAFWFTDLAVSISPIAAYYKAAFSISYLPMALAEALFGGVIVSFLVSYFLLRFFDRIPTKNIIMKSMILSFITLATIEIVSTFVIPANALVYLLVDTILNAPRFLALGIVVGLFLSKS